MPRFLVVTAALGLALPALAQAFPRESGSTPAQAGVEAPSCVVVRGEPRPDGVAFRHVVIVENRCNVAVRCELGTDVDPGPSVVRLRPGAREEIVTRSSSPAPGFTPRGRCAEAR